MIALVVSLLITLNSVEATFNRIWRVKAARPKLGRFLVYWTVLTLGALIAAASLALSARFFAMAVFDTQLGDLLESTHAAAGADGDRAGSPFAAIYRVVPHRTVKWRHALAGALLATLLFELVKWGLGVYLGRFGNYSRRSTAPLAFVPIFLLWIYLSWVAVLLGASLASSMSAFRYQPVRHAPAAGLRVVRPAAHARRASDEARAQGQRPAQRSTSSSLSRS